jgi:leader peptidase (prepilin peptidase)/N-methyltransferase
LYWSTIDTSSWSFFLVEVSTSTAFASTLAATIGNESAQGIDLIVFSDWGYLVAAILGALIGSFVNVVVIRLPKGMSVVRPGSHCMSCDAPVAWYDNLPILSYLILRGRCRRCGARFSVVYMLVEVLVAGLAVACFAHARASQAHDAWAVAGHFSAELAFCAVLAAIALIDVRTWIIPNVITYPSMAIFWGAAVSLQRLSWGEAVAGLAFGFAGLGGLILVYHWVTGREGMGWGDAKLLGLIGAFLGWQSLPLVIFLAAVQGLAAAVLLVATGRTLAPSEPYVPLEDERGEREDEEEEAQDEHERNEHEHGEGGEGDEGKREDAPTSWRHVPLPFGPFLALAGVEALLLGDLILDLLLPALSV